MGTTGFDDKNVIGLFTSSYEAQFAGSWANAISLYNGASDRGIEEYGILGANPAMREWIGARKINTLNKKPYEIRNRAYESTIGVKEAELNRDKTDMLKARLSTFASDAGAGHWEDLLTALINANGTCYDGQAFFSATHEWGDSGVQKNLVTATEIPSANVGTPTAPTATEMAGVLLESIAYMMTLKNDKGRQINGNARSFTVQVSTVQLFSALLQAITSEKVGASAADNPLNGMKAAGYTFAPQFVAGLTTATDKIRIYRNDGPIKPFILQDEQGMQIELLGRGSDHYFHNKEILLGVDASRGVGYGEPLYALDVQLS